MKEKEKKEGSLGIAPTQNCSPFLKFGFVVARGRFYSRYLFIYLDKERKIVRKKLSFMHTKRFNIFFKRWVQFRVGAILRFPKKRERGSINQIFFANIITLLLNDEC